MHPESPKLREDIRDAVAFIQEITEKVGEKEYRRNRMLRQSIERNFEITGEALRRLANSDPPTAQRIAGYSQIIAFRNILIHGYDQIDHEIVWQVVRRDVPVLHAEFAALLEEAAGPTPGT